MWIQCRQYRQSASKSIIKLNYKIQYPRNSGSKKQSRSYLIRFFFKNSSSKYQKRFAIGGYSTMFFAANCLVSFVLGLCGWQPRNRQIHRQVCWKRHRISGVVGKQRNIGFVGFLGNVEPKWCRKYRKWLCCEIFVTETKLKASLAVWRNLLP